MKPSFPLYDMIYSKTTDTELTFDEKDFFTEKISEIDNHELFYMLIKMYAVNHQMTETIPCGGKVLKKGIKFELDNCPNRLQQILLDFLKTRLSE
jgi:hypothetical protein